MRWPFVIEKWTERLSDDQGLESVLGGKGRIYPGQATRPVQIPSVEYLIVGDREDELFNPILVQVDFWARGIKKASQIERRLRLLTHRDVAQELGDERLWMQYLDSRSIEYTADPGVAHRQVDFRFTPLKEQYATS
jgi:hypothetical protein